MKIIEKKLTPDQFKPAYLNAKPFEILKDEDGLEQGDEIVLRECKDKKLTGRSVFCEITYVLRDCPQNGLMPGYCIIGLKEKVPFT